MSVIALSKAELVIDADQPGITAATEILVENMFARIEALAEQMRPALEAKAKAHLLRISYRVEVTLKPGARDALLALDLFDIQVKAD